MFCVKGNIKEIKLAEDITNYCKERSNFKFSNLTNLFTFFCNYSQFLNFKIINFLFHVIYLSAKDFEITRYQFLKKSKFIANYKVLLVFLKFVHFVINFTNNSFKMNSEKFFSEKKILIQFLIYYKFFFATIFLNENYKYNNLLLQFNFKVYSNYLLYSIFYFLRLYTINLQDLKATEKVRQNEYSLPINLDPKISQSFYNSNIFNSKDLDNETITMPKENIPLSLLCSNRTNFKTLEDAKFSVLLNNIRYVYRLKKRKKNSFVILNKIIKQAVPLSRIIYQRRGRNLIPLMTFVYSPDVRNSLGLKYILNESKKTQGYGSDSYENKLFISLLNILVSNKKEDFVYQSDQNSDIRKEAYSRGYFLKTLQAQVKKF